MEKFLSSRCSLHKKFKMKTFFFVSLNEWNAKGNFQHEYSTDKEADSEAPCEAVVWCRGCRTHACNFSRKTNSKGKTADNVYVFDGVGDQHIFRTNTKATGRMNKLFLLPSLQLEGEFSISYFLLYYAVEIGPDAICKWHTLTPTHYPSFFIFLSNYCASFPCDESKQIVSSLDCTHLSVNFGRTRPEGSKWNCCNLTTLM